MTDLSTTQREVLDMLCEYHAVTLYRLPGGFWTIKGIPLATRRVPEWYCHTGTVKALATEGVLERVGTAWGAPYQLTPMGKALRDDATLVVK